METRRSNSTPTWAPDCVSNSRSHLPLTPPFFFFNMFWILIAACRIFFFFFLQHMWSLQNVGSSSLAKNQTRPPALETWSLSHWTTREVPRSILKPGVNPRCRTGFQISEVVTTEMSRSNFLQNRDLRCAVSFQWKSSGECHRPGWFAVQPHGWTPLQNGGSRCVPNS